MSSNSYSPAGKSVLWSSASSLLVLAGPVVASQASSMMVSVADTVMTGRLGDVPLAAVSFAGNLCVPLMFLGIGIAATVTPLVGRRLGRGQIAGIGSLVAHARRLNWILTIGQVLVLLLLTVLMPYMGQPAEVVDVARFYLPILAFSMVGQQMFVCARTLCEGLQDTVSPMRIGVAGNVLNIVLNYFFIFGLGPWQGMGVYGAAVSTLVARTLMWLVMEGVLRRRLAAAGIMPPPRSPRSLHRPLWVRLFFIGLPVGAQSLVECLSFAMGGIMMGWISTEAIAAHQVVNLFTSLSYLMAGGVATAVTIKVSVSCGAANMSAAERFSKVGLAVCGVFMVSCSAVLILLRHILPGWIIDSPAAIDIAAGLMFVGALFEIFDGLQVTAIGALRGYADFSYPAKVAALSFALTGITVGYVAAFPLGIGPAGIWIGYAAGLLVASALLLHRLWKRFRTEAAVR